VKHHLQLQKKKKKQMKPLKKKNLRAKRKMVGSGTVMMKPQQYHP
jgi:hypothetical protein